MAKTPEVVERFLSAERNHLVLFPSYEFLTFPKRSRFVAENNDANIFAFSAWRLRYGGVGDTAYVGPDNSDAQDGMEQVYQAGQLSAVCRSLGS